MAESSRTCQRCGCLVATATEPTLCPVCLLESGLGESVSWPPVESELPDRGVRVGAGLGGRVLSVPPAPLRSFGDYELVGELARGGMGIVYLGRQLSLDRLVAVKFLLYGGFSSPTYVERFRAEATAAARLQHPAIVAIYEVGEHEGQHFFSMEYVSGENLAERTRRSPPPPREAAAIVQAIAEAVAFAHAEGVLHRDLKPANILLDRQGRVRVTDFGLAKRLDQDSDLTATGEVLGSPSFMAPEQVRGSTEGVGPLADIHGLGAILYFLLTGRPPYQSASVATTLELVLHEDPVAPRRLNPSVPRDLETLCLKCLAKMPGGRYASASLLAEDLGRFLRSEPVLARTVGGFERLCRWAVRRPAQAGVVGMLGLLVVALSGGGWAYGRQREHAREQERRLRAETDRKAYALSLNLAERARTEGDFERADQLLDGVRPRPGEPDLRGFEWFHLKHELRGREERILRAGTNEIIGLAANATGDRLAVLTATELELLELPEGTTRARWTLSEDPNRRSLLFLDSSEAVVLGALSGAVRYEPGKPEETLLTEPANILALSPDHRSLAFSHVDVAEDMEKEIPFGILNLASGRVLERSPRDGGPGLVWVASNQGVELRILGSRSQLTRWRPGQAPEAILPRDHFTDYAAFSPDGKRVVWDDIRGFLEFRDLGDSLDALRSGNAGGVRRVPWSVTRPLLAFDAAGSRMVLKNGGDRRIVLSRADDVSLMERYSGHRGELSGLVFLGGSSRFASASRDGSIRIWDSSKSLKNFQITNDLARYYLPNPLFSRTSESLAVTTIYRNKRAEFALFDLASGSNRLRGEGVPIAFCSGDSQLVVWDRNGELASWDLDSMGSRRTLPIGNLCKFEWPKFSANGRYLFSESADSAIWAHQMPDLNTKTLIGTNIAFIAPEPFGDGFAAFSAEGVQYWRTPFDRPKRLIDSDARALCFSASGSLFACGDINGSITVLNMPSGEVRWRVGGHGGEINAVSFAPDGRTVVSVGEDRSLRFWTVDAGELLLERSLKENGHWLIFSPGGEFLLVGWDGQYEILESVVQLERSKYKINRSVSSGLDRLSERR